MLGLLSNGHGRMDRRLFHPYRSVYLAVCIGLLWFGISDRIILLREGVRKLNFETNDLRALKVALELMEEENGTVWYTYANNEYGEPVYLMELRHRIEKEIEQRA